MKYFELFIYTLQNLASTDFFMIVMMIIIVIYLIGMVKIWLS